MIFYIAIQLFTAFNIPFHGDLHERIQMISDEIEEYPDSTLLYLKRGELYFQHEVYDSSGYDFEKCELLGNFPSSRLYFSYAKTLKMQEKNDLAIFYLDKILVDEPHNVNTLRLKGKILVKQGDYCDAGRYFKEVIDHAKATLPFNFLEASNAYQQCDSDNAYNKSIEILQSGLSSLGPLVTFYNELIKISLEYKNYDQAIIYQSLIIESSNRKEFSLYKRAKLHLLNGEIPLAKKDIDSAKKAIELLPERIKINRSTKELIININSFLSKS